MGMKWRYAIAALAVACILTSCGPNVKTIQRMQSLEEHVGNPTTIEELTEAIGKYQNRVEDIITAETRVGIWYKILATRYLDKGMYGKALETFRKAIEYYPENQNLYYYVGVCAGYMAKSALDFDATGTRAARDRYLNLAETAYLRAIELQNDYFRPLYGLSVLYIFELNRPEDAIPYIERALDVERKNIEAMFVAARAYYMTGKYDAAIDMYDRILSLSPDKERKAQAEANKSMIIEKAYER
jgi:tetratricopeptide (TPR) repeat protein